jgi:tetratricopeptide (TPR) repeat protein
MKKYKVTLEGGHRLLRLRRIKRVVYVLQLGLMVVVAAYLMVEDGASLKPLYLPLEAFLPIVLLWLLALTVQNFVFRAMEIRYARRDSQRHLIARNSQTAALWVIVFSAFVIALLLLPATNRIAADAVSTEGDGFLAPGNVAAVSFANQDLFGVRQAEWFEVAVEGGPAEIRVYVDNASFGTFSLASGGKTIVPIARSGYHEYRIEIVAQGGDVAFVWSLRAGLMPALVTFVPFVAVFFVFANSAWYLYLSPIKDRYASSSIYSIEYMDRVGEGEETFAVRRRSMRRPAASIARSSLYEGAASQPAPPPPPPPEAGEPEPVPPPAAIRPPAISPSPPPPKDANLLVAEGASSLSRQEFEEALGHLDDALETEPDHPRALVLRGVALLKLGKPSEAMQAFRRCLEVDPDNERARQHVALLLHQERRFEEAVEAMDAYLSLRPNDIEFLVKKGDTLLLMDRKEEALRVFEHALTLAPGDERIASRMDKIRVDVPSLLSKALIASASGHYTHAIALFDRILDHEPDNANALLGKGVALHRAGQHDLALETFEAVLDGQPAHLAGLLYRARLLAAMGRPEEALETYDRGVEYHPEDGEMWAGRAGVLEELDRLEEAWESCRRAAETGADVTEQRSRIEGRLDEAKRTRAALLAVKGIGPAKADALLAAGFRSTDDLRRATRADLAKVKGITPPLADALLARFAKDGGDGTG